MSRDEFGGTSADEVLALVAFLEAHAIVYQINGGWAVDVLAGAQTRAHRDVDVFVDAERVREVDAWLTERGYEVEIDVSPVRVEWVAVDQRVDVHPMVISPNGDGVQQGFGDEVFVHRAVDRTRGHLAGRLVVVANARRLRELREGYSPRPQDVHDLAVLSAYDGDAEEDRLDV